MKDLCLIGDIQVHHDLETKKLLWVEGFERYYPKGIEDPDYCVLKFTTKKVSFYNNLEELTVDIDEG
ncbi:pyridoxamine 5'-phosphate oxidase family protein [Clostridiaceae bacterium M8S5]|nr:pyridoxamine 5'-phosphate oxidase family protein [Clostridiaceae bacterium M8S5]